MPNRPDSATALTLINTTLALTAGTVLVFFLTDGLNAFTAEGARRYSIEKSPVTLPHIQLLSSDGELFYLQNFQDRAVLVDFIFTRCVDSCPIMTQRFREVHEYMLKADLKDKQPAFVTISFDPARDTGAALQKYAAAANIDTALWRFAAVADPQQLQSLLDAFGIIVIPASNGQFEHNGAIHRVDPVGKLSRIYDYTSTEQIVQDLQTQQAGSF